MPNLNDATADGYAAFWEVLRMSLLVLGVCLSSRFRACYFGFSGLTSVGLWECKKFGEKFFGEVPGLHKRIWEVAQNMAHESFWTFEDEEGILRVHVTKLLWLILGKRVPSLGAGSEASISR